MRTFRNIVGAICVVFFSSAQASLITMESPTSAGMLPEEYPDYGGIILDVIGLNGERVVSYLPGSELYKGVVSRNDAGQPDVGETVMLGIDNSLDASLLAILGGGFAEMAIRLSVWDGDNAFGEPDHDDNYLLVNDYVFGNFSDVTTEARSRDGQTLYGTNTGFGDNELGTGWFYSDDAALLSSIYDSVLTDGVEYKFEDKSKSDNFISLADQYDNGAKTPQSGGQHFVKVPEPSMLALSGLGLFALVATRRRQIK